MKKKDTPSIDRALCEDILNHLLKKHNYQDNLEGLVLAMSLNEIEKFTEELLKNLAYLMSEGFIYKTKNHNLDSRYRLSKGENELRRFIESISNEEP